MNVHIKFYCSSAKGNWLHAVIFRNSVWYSLSYESGIWSQFEILSVWSKSYQISVCIWFCMLTCVHTFWEVVIWAKQIRIVFGNVLLKFHFKKIRKKQIFPRFEMLSPSATVTAFTRGISLNVAVKGKLGAISRKSYAAMVFATVSS